jgi:sec-independent protein translocase protein TatA
MLGLDRWWIIVLILVIVLIVYGPGKLPEVGGAIGRAMREFRRASNDLQDEIKRSATTSPASADTTTQSAPPTGATDAKPTDTKA